MDFGYSPTVEQWRERVQGFLDEVILPAEHIFHEQVHAQAATSPWARPPIMEELKGQARERGLWNLFLPGAEFGAGLTNLEYAPLAELSGRSPMLAPEAMNCAAPDSGNMEVFAHFAKPDLRAGRDRAQVVVERGHGAGVQGRHRDGPVSAGG